MKDEMDRLFLFFLDVEEDNGCGYGRGCVFGVRKDRKDNKILFFYCSCNQSWGGWRVDHDSNGSRRWETQWPDPKSSMRL